MSYLITIGTKKDLNESQKKLNHNEFILEDLSKKDVKNLFNEINNSQITERIKNFYFFNILSKKSNDSDELFDEIQNYAHREHDWWKGRTNKCFLYEFIDLIDNNEIVLIIDDIAFSSDNWEIILSKTKDNFKKSIDNEFKEDIVNYMGTDSYIFQIITEDE